MGLLDDAIREHLDLKRRRGADPTEVEREEREVLGPVRRRGELAPHDQADLALAHDDELEDELEHEPLPLDDAPWDDEMAEPRTPAAFDHGDDEPLQRPYRDAREPYGAPDPPPYAPLEPEPYSAREPDPYSAREPEPYSTREPEPYSAPEPSRYAADAGPEPEPYSAREPPRYAADAGPEPDPYSEQEPPRYAADAAREPDPYRAPEPQPYVGDSAGPDRYPGRFAADPEPEPAEMDEATAEFSIEDAHAAEDKASPKEGVDEDVLEETPEFLQDTPDHDRLWFEQRPPRDFDFDG
jgi:hypothetical protein